MTLEQQAFIAEYRGSAENIRDGVVQGWAWCPATPDARLEVEAVADGTVLARVRADVVRPDLKRAQIGDGGHGFRLSLPRGVLIGADLEIRIAGTELALPVPDPALWPSGSMRLPLTEADAVRVIGGDGDRLVIDGGACPSCPASHIEIRHGGRVVAEAWPDPAELRAGPLTLLLGRHGAMRMGDLEILAWSGEESVPALIEPGLADQTMAGLTVRHGGEVTGWVAPRRDGCPRRLKLVCDGQTVWEGAPLRQGEGGQTSLRVILPDPEDWSRPRTVVLQEAASGRALTSEHTVRPRDRFRGSLESCLIGDGTVTVKGWAQDQIRPYDPQEIAFVAGDVVFGPVLAREHRVDLEALDVGVGRHAFTAELPLPDGLAPGATVEARIAGSDVAYATCTVEAAPDAAAGPGIDLRTAAVDYRVDRISTVCVEGWARYRAAPSEPVLVDLYIDGSFYQSTLANRHRPDVARHYKDDEDHGFRFELSPALATEGEVEISVRPRLGRVEQWHPVETLRLGPDATALNGQGHRAPWAPPAAPVPEMTLAFIVINLNGAQLLEALFEGFARTGMAAGTEILVIDHGSTDRSAVLCAEWATRLPLRFLFRGRNHSFSDSNNFGARQTDAEIVVFLNNDIVPCHDMVPALLAPFADPEVGAVGLKLYDQRHAGGMERTPLQHLGVHFEDRARDRTVAAFETRYAPHLEHVSDDMWEVPAVTGAVLACRREEFLEIGGFDEGYFYGYEDVDLCLRLGLGQGRRIVCNNRTGAYHVRGYSRSRRRDPAYAARQKANALRLQERCGPAVRAATRADRFARPGFWSTRLPVIGFAVTQASLDTAAGDYFTALDLAEELRARMPCQIVFPEISRNWYDMTGIDVLISMRDDYDLRKLKNAAPHLLKIGWARNWIERWGERPWAQDHDLIWASSCKSADHLAGALGRAVDVVRIATRPERFRAGRFREDLASDYCFTGSFFGAPREIIYNLDPAAIPWRFALFGHGWDKVPQLRDHCRGSLPYSAMADVYASTRVVIDDANTATKPWGSVNSRVFDATAAGALVLTNGRAGAEEVFGDLLPTYDSPQELEALLHRYLGDEDLRRNTVAKLQEVLEAGHTYGHRAGQVAAALERTGTSRRFSIKIGAPNDAVREDWGDYHFALGLKKALLRLGHRVRIDCLDRWDRAEGLDDDVVIVLRGLSAWTPRPHQVTVMWNISHPHEISRAEYEHYDHVFIASLTHAERLAGELEVPVTPLLQCCDPELFHGDHPEPETAPELVFVGNSRNEFRPMVRDAVALGLPVEVHGTLWEQFIDDSHLKGDHVANSELSALYAAAGAVLNDHWEDMRELGFMSNRLFDAAASGAFVITDPVAGLEEIFDDSIAVAATPGELAEAAALPRTDPERVARMRSEAQARVRKGHSFDDRAAEIETVALRLLAEKEAIPGAPANV